MFCAFIKKVTSVDTGIGFTPLLVCRQPWVCDSSPEWKAPKHCWWWGSGCGAEAALSGQSWDLNATRSLLTWMSLLLFCVPGKTQAWIWGMWEYLPQPDVRRLCARDRPYVLRYHDSEARENKFKSMEKYRNSAGTHNSIETWPS